MRPSFMGVVFDNGRMTGTRTTPRNNILHELRFRLRLAVHSRRSLHGEGSHVSSYFLHVCLGLSQDILYDVTRLRGLLAYWVSGAGGLNVRRLN